MKSKGCLGIIIFFVIMAAGFVITILNENIKPAESKVVFDALQYAVQDEKNISEAELIAKLGEPDSIEEWNYKTSDTAGYPIRTLHYGKTEYSFNNDALHRVTIWDRMPYNKKKDFLSMFNLKKYANTTINDTGFYYRAYNCGVHDLWLEYDDAEISMVKISYSSLFSGD